MRDSRKIAAAIVLNILNLGAAVAAPKERVTSALSAPALVKYIPGDPQKPLVVFVPGAGHLARIAYGAPGARDRDFLAYWLHQQGYGFLAISYPLGGVPEMSGAPVPAFTLTDWGRQAVEITNETVTTNHLGKQIILVGWSMGGRILGPYSEAAATAELKVDVFVSLAATPGIYRLIPRPAQVQQSPAGYSRVPGAVTSFQRQLAYQNKLNGHVIIPPEAYKRDYVGDTPIGLTGWGLKYTPTGFVEDRWSEAEAARAFDYANLPLTAAIYGDSSLDPAHALADRANWGFVLTNVLLARVRAAAPIDKLSPEQWAATSLLISNAPSSLSAQVEGDHFFFVGETGARKTANLIVEMGSKARALTQGLPKGRSP